MARLGQHFLRNRGALARIAGALEIGPGETVLEIGPGHGELTGFLLEAGAKVIVLERDPALAGDLERGGRVEVVRGDALRTLGQRAEKIRGAYKLAGNIPYYITGKLFRILSDLPKKPSRTVLTIQREVAARAAAEPPEMNRLAASIRFWAEPKVIMSLPARDFSPPPKVDSAVLLLAALAHPVAANEPYFLVVRSLFKQPRKTIANNLLPFFRSRGELDIALRAIGLDPNSRPQDATIEQVVLISSLPQIQ